MLQENISGYPLLLPTVDPPVTVPHGGRIEHDEPLAGFEPVEKQTKDKPETKTKEPGGDKE